MVEVFTALDAFPDIFPICIQGHNVIRRQEVIEFSAQRMIGCPQGVFKQALFSFAQFYAFIGNHTFSGGRHGACFIEDHSIDSGHLFNGIGIFEVKFSFSENT